MSRLVLSREGADPPPVAAIIDAHHHLWDISQASYPWLQGPLEDPDDRRGIGPLQRNYLIADYLDDTAGEPVIASVHVEAGRPLSDSLRETCWLESLSHDGNIPAALVAKVRLQDPDIGSRLSDQLAHPQVRGVRQMLNWKVALPPDAPHTAERGDLMEDPAWRSGLAKLRGLGLSFDLQVFPCQLRAASELVASEPEISFVLEHGGYMSLRSEDDDALWRDGLQAMSRLANVSVKISDYSTMDPSFDLNGYVEYVRRLIDAFGPSRSMFASNFPTEGRTVSYPDLVYAFSKATSHLSGSEREQVFSSTAARVYRL
jgi:predicted TIM-barrel fold metal-dependent hydrolase